MRNNEKGVTLIALVITIIIMSILAITTITTGDLIGKAKFQSIASNMLLIQAKVRIINERFSFNEDPSIYVGKKLKDQTDKSIIANGALTSTELDNENLYVYDRDTLDSIGLEGINLPNDTIYIVNYENCDIIWPSGVENENGEKLYKLSEILEEIE